MKFIRGDKVILIHTKEKGEVLGLEEKGLYLVEVDGHEIPVFEEDLIAFNPAFDDTVVVLLQKAKGDPVEPIAKKLPDRKLGFNEGVFLCFFSKKEESALQPTFRVQLVNDTKATIKFKIELFLKGSHFFQLKSKVEPFDLFYLLDFEADHLNDSPVFSLRLESPLFETGFKELNVRIKPSGFFKKKKNLKLVQEPTYTYELYFPPKEKDRKPEEKKSGNPKIDIDLLKTMMTEGIENKGGHHDVESGIHEIDLHIEELMKNPVAYSTKQIVEIQLKELETSLDRAIANHFPSFRIIHGVGERKLKRRVHQILKSHPHVRTFTNHFDAEHGFGGITVAYF